MSFEIFISINVALLWVAVVMNHLLMRRVIERSNLPPGMILSDDVTADPLPPLQSGYGPDSVLPVFQVEVSDGRIISNHVGGPTCFVFVSQDCDTCGDLLKTQLDGIRAAVARRGMDLVVADITPRTSLKRSRRFFEEHLGSHGDPWATVPLSDSNGLGGILGVRGTPSFAAISSGALVAAGWMSGEDWEQFLAADPRTSKQKQAKEGMANE